MRNLLVTATLLVAIMFASVPVWAKEGRVIYVRQVNLNNLSSDNNVSCREVVVPSDDTLSTVFLCRHRSEAMCFVGSSEIKVMRSSDFGVTWSKAYPVMSSLSNLCITSVVDMDGCITAYFNITDNSRTEIILSGDLQKWGGGTYVIYSVKSYDNAQTWSAPQVAIKHNAINLEHAVITYLPSSTEGGFLALINRKDGNGILISRSKDGAYWSYPEYIGNEFNGKLMALDVRGKRAYVLYYDDENIYLWRGNYYSLESVGLNHLGDTVLKRNNKKQPPHFVKVGKLSGYVCD